jgi:hypothetical protein
MSARTLKQQVGSDQKVAGEKTVSAKQQSTAVDDLQVGRRRGSSFKELEIEQTMAVEKKANLGFGRRNKTPAQLMSQNDEHIEDNILYFSDGSFLSPCYLSPMTLGNKTWLTCLHYYLVAPSFSGHYIGYRLARSNRFSYVTGTQGSSRLVGGKEVPVRLQCFRTTPARQSRQGGRRTKGLERGAIRGNPSYN